MFYAIYANNEDADQPAHTRGLISVFVVRCLDSIIHILAKSKSSRPMLASVAEKTGFSLTWWQTPEDGFSHDKAQMMSDMRV